MTLRTRMALALTMSTVSGVSACSTQHSTLPIAARAANVRHPSTPPPVPGGHIHYTITDDATGRQLPARLIVRGVDGTPDPQLGPPYRAQGAATLVISPAGHGDIEISPGHYLITFSHGLEWSIDRVRAEVSADSGAIVSGSLHHVIPMDDWTACDFHVHSAGSFDSQVAIQDRVASLVAEGIEFATPTEHNVVGDYAAGVRALPAAASAEQGGPGLLWVPAVEITTDVVGNPVGHFNAFPYAADPAKEHGGPPAPESPPGEIFREVHDHDPTAIVQVNHPRMSGMGYFDLMGLDSSTNRARSPLYDPNYDAIEVFNGFYLGDPIQVNAVMQDWFALLNSGAHYVGTANSDSHVIAYNEAGYPRTYVFTPGAGDRSAEPATVIHSLRGGHAFGTSGPMLFARIGNAEPGDTVQSRSGDVVLQVRVLAAPWVDVDQVDVVRDGQVVSTLPVPPERNVVRLDQAVRVAVTRPLSYIVLVARGDEPLDVVLPQLNARSMAFTNPIWIERGTGG